MRITVNVAFIAMLTGSLKNRKPDFSQGCPSFDFPSVANHLQWSTLVDISADEQNRNVKNRKREIGETIKPSTKQVESGALMFSGEVEKSRSRKGEKKRGIEAEARTKSATSTEFASRT